MVIGFFIGFMVSLFTGAIITPSTPHRSRDSAQPVAILLKIFRGHVAQRSLPILVETDPCFLAEDVGDMPISMMGFVVSRKSSWAFDIRRRMKYWESEKPVLP